LALIRCALAAWPRPSDKDADKLDLEAFQVAEASKVTEASKVAESTRVAGTRTRAVNPVHGDLMPLIVRGLVAPGDRLRHQKVRSGIEFHATVTGSGGLDTSAGHFRAPSSALSKLVGSSRNGWTDWTHVPTGKTLAELREMLRDSLRDGAENDGEADG
jgi:hypothetical protein